MTDKLNEGDVMDIEVIKEAVKGLKQLKPVKPINGYYWLAKDRDGEWVLVNRYLVGEDAENA